MSSDTAAPPKPLTAAALLMSGQAVRPVPIVPVGHEYEPALRRRNSSTGSSAPSSAAGSARPPDAPSKPSDAKPTPVVKTAMQIAMEDMAALQLAEANMFAGAQVRKPNVARSGSTVHATQPQVPAPLKPTLLSAKADASPSSSAEFTLSADASAPPLQNAAPKKTPSATKMSSSTHVVVSDDEFTFSPDAKPPAAKPAASALAVPKPPSGAALSDLISSDDEEHFSLGRAPVAAAAAAPPAVAEPAQLHSKTSLRVSVVKQDAVEKPPPSLYTGSTTSFHNHHSGTKQRHESVVKATPGSLRNAVSPDEGGAMEKSTRRSAIQSAATTTFSIASDSAHPSPGTTTATPATALVSGPSDDATEPPPLPAAKAGPATSGFVHRDSVASSTGFSSVPSDSDDESHSRRRSSNNMASKPTPPKPVAPSKASEPSFPAQVPPASNRGAAAVANAFSHKESGVKRRLRPAGSTAASSAAPSVEATPLLASSGLGADKKSPILQASEDAKALRKAKSEGSLLNSKQPSPAAGLLATSGSATVLPAADAYAKAKQDAEQLLASQREKPVATPPAPLALSSSHDANAYQRAREDAAKLVAIQAAPPPRDLQPSASSGSLSARAPLGSSGPSLSGADAYRRAKDDAAALISSQQSSPPGGLAALPPRSFSAPALPTPPSQTHLATSSRGAQQPTAAAAALGTLRVERRRDAPPAVAFTGEIVTAATPTPESRQLDSQTDMIGGGGSGATAAALFLTKTRDPSPVKRSTAARPTQGPKTSPTKRTTAATISPTTQRTKQAAGDNALVVRRAAAGTTSNGSAIVPQPPSPSSATTTPRKIFVDSVSVGATEVVVPASNVPTTVCVLPTNGHSYAATADTAPPPVVAPPLYAQQQPLLTTSIGAAAPPMQLQPVTLLDGSTALAVMPFAVPQAPSMAMVTPRQQPTQQLALAAPQTMQPPPQQQHQPSGMSVLMDGRGAALVDPSGAALMGPLQALHAPTAGRQYLQQHPPAGGSAAPLAPEEALRQVAASRWYANAPDSIQKLLRVQPAAGQGTQLTPRNPNVQVDDALLANFLSANPRPAHGEYRQLYAVQQQNPMRYNNNGQQPSNDNRGWWGGQPQQQQPQAASARGGNVQGGLIEQLALLNQSTSARRQRVQQWGY